MSAQAHSLKGLPWAAKQIWNAVWCDVHPRGWGAKWLIIWYLAKPNQQPINNPINNPINPTPSPSPSMGGEPLVCYNHFKPLVHSYTRPLFSSFLPAPLGVSEYSWDIYLFFRFLFFLWSGAVFYYICHRLPQGLRYATPCLWSVTPSGLVGCQLVHSLQGLRYAPPLPVVKAPLRG